MYRMDREALTSGFAGAAIMTVVLAIAAACDRPSTAVPGHLRNAACVLESLPAGALEGIADMESRADKLAALAELMPAIHQCYPDR